MSKILEGNITKRPHSKTTYTKKQIEELEKCSAHNEDGYMYFMTNFGYLMHPTKGKMLFKPFEYQKRLLENYHNYQFNINMLGRQMGKALYENTDILTPNGFVKMKDLQIGDYVFDENGEKTQIINKTFKQLNRDCYEVAFNHGETIIADGEHLWNVYDCSLRKNATFTTKQLIERLEINKRIGKAISIKCSKALGFEKQDVDINPYDLGLWLGDGFSRNNKITTEVNDYYEYRELTNLSEGKFRKGSKTCIDFKFENFTIDKLKELDLYKNKHIPRKYIFNTIDTRLELLRGLMDTDGVIEKNGVCRFYQSDYELIKDVRLLLSTLGIKSTLRAKETKTKTAYTLCFVCNDFDVCKLSRKLERQRRNKNHPKNKNFYFESITKVDSVPVYCIEVDSPSHLFLAGHTLIPTHNCVQGDTKITIRNKTTQEVKEVTIKEFFEMMEQGYN